jgi:hypothetical protein
VQNSKVRAVARKPLRVASEKPLRVATRKPLKKKTNTGSSSASGRDTI